MHICVPVLENTHLCPESSIEDEQPVILRYPLGVSGRDESMLSSTKVLLDPSR